MNKNLKTNRSDKTYNPCRNASGGNIAAFKGIKISGDSTTYDIPTGVLIAAVTDKCIGITTAQFDDGTNMDLLVKGRLVGSGLDTQLAAVGDFVYLTATGDLSLIPSILQVGQVETLAASGTLYINVDGMLSGTITPSYTVTPTITAFAGGGQLNAVVLTSMVNRIDVCATPGDSVKLPSSFAEGSEVVVINDGAERADLFPASGDTINGMAADTAIQVLPGYRITLKALVSNSSWIVVSSIVQEIIPFTTVGEVGDSDQIMGGHDLTADEETIIGSMVAIYNLNDNTDLSGNSNTLNDADAYNGDAGILNIATSCHLGVNGQHLQADNVTGFSGTGDLSISIGGWHKALASSGLLAVGTNSALQKIQYYTDANGFVVFDVAGFTAYSFTNVLNEFHHIALVYDQVNSLAYGHIDGQCECTIAVTSNLALQASPSIWINSKTDGTLEVASYHDEIFVYEGVLTQKQIDLLSSVKISELSILSEKNYKLFTTIKLQGDVYQKRKKLLKIIAIYNGYIYMRSRQFSEEDIINITGEL